MQQIDWATVESKEPVFVTNLDREQATNAVNRFRSQRNLKPYPDGWLPECCLAVCDTDTKDPIAVCSMSVAVGSFHGTIDDLHTDINVSQKIRAIAIDAIVHWAEKAASEFGLKFLDFYTSAPPVMKHALNHDFEFINETYVRYVKRVGK